MPQSIPFTDWVYDAWDQLVLDKGAKLSFAERYAGWQALYERCYIDGKWTIPVHDAELVTSLGFYQGWETRSFQDSRDRVRELLDHPDFAQLSRWESHDWVAKEATATFLCGDTGHALGQLRRCLETRGHGELVLLRASLYMLLEALGPDHVPSEGLVALVADVIAAHPGRKRLAKSVRTANTTSELQDALDRSYVRPNGPITR